MDARFQRRVQRYGWDKASTAYEQYWRAQLQPAQTRLLALADIKPGAHVLDIACGTGLVTFPAARAAGAAGRVVGTDLSQEMVNRAADEARALGLTQVTFQRMDAEDLELETESFDVALCALGLMYVPDPLKALAEMRRLLRPGGRAVAAVWGERRHCGWAEIFPIVDRRVASDVCPMFFQLGTGDMLQNLMHTAGFEGVRADRISPQPEYASPADAGGPAFVGGPVALAYSRFDALMRDAAHAEYLASIEPYKRQNSYEVPGEFVIATGTSPGA